MYRAPKWLVAVSAVFALIALFALARLFSDDGVGDLAIDEIEPQPVFTGNPITVTGTGCPAEGDVAPATADEVVLLAGPEAGHSRLAAIVSDNVAEVFEADNADPDERRTSASAAEDGTWSATITIPRGASGTWELVALCTTLITADGDGSGPTNAAATYTTSTQFTVS